MNLATALITIVMSGVVAAVVTYHLNTTKEHVFFMRKKAEELYLAAESFDRSLSSYFIGGYPLVKGEISWNDFNDLAIKNADKVDEDASLQVLMLIDIYFPKLQPIFGKYLEQRTALHRVLNEHKRAYKTGSVGEEFFKPFDLAMRDLSTRAKELKAAIIVEAQEFTAKNQLWPWKRP